MIFLTMIHTNYKYKYTIDYYLLVGSLFDNKTGYRIESVTKVNYTNPYHVAFQ